MAFTPTNVNDWLFTIAGLDAANGNTQPVPQPFLGQYVTELNPVPPATTPVATPAEIQANLENFPVNPNAPPPNIVTDTFFRTTVADFVLREFQLAWGVVPTSGAAASQYDAWVARVIDNPANMTAGGMSAALVGTPEFQLIFGSNPTATPATIALLCAHAGVPVGAGALANVGLPMAQVLQNFAENSLLVSNALAAPIANFQNLLLNAAPGAPPPAGNLLTLSGTPGANLTLTTGVDTPTTGFSGTGATATQAGAVFLAPPGTNILGASNTLNAGDNLVATGAALNNSTLNYTAVDSLTGNPADAVGVTMTGVSAAVVTVLTAGGASVSGTITGLTAATLAAGSVGGVALGAPGNGLNTALATVNVNAAHDLTAFMTAAALAAAPAGTVNVNGGVITNVLLDNAGATTGYLSLTVHSTGPGGTTTNDLVLDIGAATNTATVTIDPTSTEALTISGTALNIDNLHTFTGNSATTPPGPDTGGLTVTFTNPDGAGNVAVTGGSGVNTFTFDEITVGATAGQASFTAASTVNGGSGATNTLDIQAATGAILLAGVGAGITGIDTIEHNGAQNGTPIAADLSQMGSATTFDLHGDYNALVTVSNITALQTVEFSGTSVAGADLTLDHAAPAAGQVFNFTMSQNAPDGPGGTLDLAALTVALPAPGVQQVDLDSTGNAANNNIDNVSGVAANITVTGATHLTLGDAVGAYIFNPDVAGGATINASAATGGVEAWLGNVGGPNPSGNAVQTFTSGAGTNLVHVLNSGGDIINFSAAGGTNTVDFQWGTNADAANPIDGTALANQYNQVLGFNAGTTININVADVNASLAGQVLANPGGGADVAAGDAIQPFNFITNSVGATATAGSNFVDITSPIVTTIGETAQAAFAQAMGPVGTITTFPDNPGHNAVMGSFFDTTTQQAVYFVDTNAFTPMEALDPIHVVGLVHMNATQYAANAATAVHFV